MAIAFELIEILEGRETPAMTAIDMRGPTS